ncbi:MAG TPA: Asp23/Gls24 family envelope stress response protein [Clostridiaceae bacterium]|jgi:uncharacterized alkaline shock family protein YloU|nr:Asp23/Gls24 family envelope stress response protein [Clostridiaceae bacterium]
MSEDLVNITADEEALHEDKLKIVDEVIETIAGIEATKVQCVTSMSGGFTDGLAGILGKKNLGKGVRVETLADEVKVFLSIVVEYGCRIHMVAKDVQNAVRTSIQDMTGLKVLEVNINVVGISISKQPKKEEEEVDTEV